MTNLPTNLKKLIISAIFSKTYCIPLIYKTWLNISDFCTAIYAYFCSLTFIFISVKIKKKRRSLIFATEGQMHNLQVPYFLLLLSDSTHRTA